MNLRFLFMMVKKNIFLYARFIMNNETYKTIIIFYCSRLTRKYYKPDSNYYHNS